MKDKGMPAFQEYRLVEYHTSIRSWPFKIHHTTIRIPLEIR